MLEPFRNPDDESLRRLLESVRRIAVGLSPKPYRYSHRVARCPMVDHARLLGPKWTRS